MFTFFPRLRSRLRLWRLEKGLRVLDWEIDDVDDEMLTERYKNGQTATFYAHHAQLQFLHAQRRRLCDVIVGLKLNLDIEPEPLDHLSKWVDSSPMVDLSAAQADAEVRRIRSL
jgi:hypothetical protein